MVLYDAAVGEIIKQTDITKSSYGIPVVCLVVVVVVVIRRVKMGLGYH